MNESIAQRLRQAAAALTQERIALRDLAALHGAAVDGTLLVLLGALCVVPVPGLGTLAGAGLFVLALSTWRGCSASALPPRLAQFEISGTSARRLLGGLAHVYAFAQRFARPGEMRETNRAMSALVIVMAVLIVLPIPFGNLLPGLSVAALGLATVFRDGRAAVLSLVLSALAVAFAASVLAVAGYGGWCAIASSCNLQWPA